MPDRSGAARTPCVRIPADVVGDRPGRCPVHRRASVDHALPRPGRYKPEPLCTDPLTALGAALDLVELEGRTIEEACAHLPRPGERPRDHLGTPLSPLHEGLLTWVEHAVRVWVRALADLPGPARIPCAQPWLLRFPPRGAPAHARTYEVLAGGRGYTFLEGADRVRELRIPVVDALAEGPPGPADAVAAHVLAAGTPVDRPAMGAEPWRHRGGLPLPVRGEVPPPDRVRVLRVSCADGSEGLRFEGTPAEAEHLYRARGRPALRTVPLRGGPRVPGPDCGPCKLQRGCDAPARVPGLLGFRDRSRPRRTWSVGAGLRHRACPAAAHLHGLGLPGGPPSPEEEVRSRLARAHARSPRRACSEEPAPGTDPQVARLLTAHARGCPLHTVPASAPVHAGLRLPVQDPLADVLVMARIDLLHREGASWVQRQTVLTEPVTEPDGPSLLAAHPALAVSVLLFACGVVPPGPRSRVELEALTQDGSQVHTLDPFSPGLRTRARAVVSELASPWHQDTVHAPTPGPACASCRHRRWCPESPEP